MSKTLYLMRHAKSDWGDPGLSDHERPLNERGLRATQTVARHIRDCGIRPELVVCSSALRTRETLAGVAAGFGEPAPRIEIEDELYDTTAGSMLERVHAIPEDVSSAMLIAHNPSTHDLAVLLAGSGEQLERMAGKFPTAALATLAATGAWADLNPGVALLEAFVTPKELA
jgi:phosphohistidine phosphatase